MKSICASAFAIANRTYIVEVFLVRKRWVCVCAYGMGVRRRHCVSLLVVMNWMMVYVSIQIGKTMSDF